MKSREREGIKRVNRQEGSLYMGRMSNSVAAVDEGIELEILKGYTQEVPPTATPAPSSNVIICS
jgi:hypothetical protein